MAACEQDLAWLQAEGKFFFMLREYKTILYGKRLYYCNKLDQSKRQIDLGQTRW